MTSQFSYDDNGALREGPPEPSTMTRAAEIGAALHTLRACRDSLRAAGAVRAARRVGEAIKSAEGAFRHAILDNVRAQRQAAARTRRGGKP